MPHNPFSIIVIHTIVLQQRLPPLYRRFLTEIDHHVASQMTTTNGANDLLTSLSLSSVACDVVIATVVVREVVDASNPCSKTEE